jgi:glycosyltransferase involved in cell wall biosynthesis
MGAAAAPGRGATRVLVLNQYYPPDVAATGLHAGAIAERLARDGFEVTAVVGQPSYTAGTPEAPSRERRGGVDVRRIGLGRRRGREALAHRIGGYLRYLAGAWRASRDMRPDAILCFHNPPFVGLVAARLARRSGARLVYVPQDIHPDVLVATGWLRLPRPAIAAWDRANRAIFAAADRIVVLGDGMKATLVERKGLDPASVEVIPLWAEPELEPRPVDRAWRADNGVAGDDLVVLYSGNMGVMQPLDAVLDAAARLTGAPVAFLLAGTGVRREHWEREAARRGLSNVRFLPFQQADGFARMVAAADVTVVSLRPGMERLSVPSRTFAFLAAGRPVIALMAPDSDVARLVRTTGAGWTPAGHEELRALLEELAGDTGVAERAGRAAFEASYRRDVVTARYVELLRALTA